MAIRDAFASAEESVTRYPIAYQKEKIYVYELKLSNAEEVLRQCLALVQRDATRQKRFVLVFNAKHVKSTTVGLMKLKKILDDYKDLLFSDRLLKFAIIVKSFILHRRVIGMFDDIFDEAGVSRSKYNYFTMKDKDKMLQWLVADK
ncbi:MAG: hypothetical protein K8R90_00240 [Candidatus Cloacimonetes bacterium]|nr:hypothetical protein [Candidatus Cloacimonadota bacterium]